MEDKICQSCGMPMSERDDSVGTNFDGTMSSEYCSSCYHLGEFTLDVTFEELVEEMYQLLLEDENHWEEDEAREYIVDHLSKLRRWKKSEPTIELYDNPQDPKNEV